MFAFPPLSKAAFTSGPEEKGSTVCEGMRAAVGRAASRLSAHRYLQACEGRLGAFIYLFISFKATYIPRKSRRG